MGLALTVTKIMLLRHAEKPNAYGTRGVAITGSEDRRSLTVRGWQRAGALIALFGPALPRHTSPLLATPTTIFASRPTANSARSLHTLEPLAQRLSIDIDVSYGDAEEAALAARAAAANGVVLISWKHDGLPKLGNAIVGNTNTCPQLWPKDRFDLVWVFDRPIGAAAWSFTQVPQLLLPGDRAEPIV